MKRLLIAVNSSLLRDAMVRQLSNEFLIFTCDDGEQALEAFPTFRPDVLLVDMLLPRLDGLSMLRHAALAGFRPKTVAVSFSFSDPVIQALTDLDVCCLMRIPCDSHQLALRLREAALQNRHNSLDEKIAYSLVGLGIPMNCVGFACLSAALRHLCRSGSMPMGRLTELVARDMGSTPTAVEKAMRDAIGKGWKRRKDKTWQLYFPVGRSGKVDRPCSSLFLSRMAYGIAPDAGIKEA